MNKYKKLINNSFIFAIGNLGSKLMQFIMIPLYSYILTEQDFGKVDVLTTIISILSLIMCLNITDAVFRFALDKSENEVKIFSIGFWIIIIVSLFALFFSIIISKIFPTYPIILTSLLLSITMLNSLAANFSRATGFIKQFAIAGIINTFVMGVLNVILLVCFKIGMNGYMMSMILGLLSATIYLFISCRLYNYLSLKGFDILLFKQMCKYSLPLVPNGIAWWLNAASDRIFIVIMLGASANGLYAMANKIPNMLSVLTNIFFQSWQISVVEEYKDNDAEKFITNVFNNFISFMFLIGLVIIAFIRPLFKIIISSSYYNGWTLTPYLVLAIIYANISSFLETIYMATKKTMPIFLTCLYGAIANIIFSVILIKFIGISGAAIANILSFLIVSAFRLIHVIKIKKIKLNLKKIILLHMIFLFASFVVLNLENNYLAILIVLLLILTQIFIDKESRGIIGKIFSRLNQILGLKS